MKMEDARWYFTHETREDRLWYQTFASMCRKFGVSWPAATPAQRAFVEEITRVNYEREMLRLELRTRPVRGFFDDTASV